MPRLLLFSRAQVPNASMQLPRRLSLASERLHLSPGALVHPQLDAGPDPPPRRPVPLEALLSEHIRMSYG